MKTDCKSNIQNLHQSQQKCQPSNFHSASTYNMKGNNNIAISTSGKRKSTGKINRLKALKEKVKQVHISFPTQEN